MSFRHDLRPLFLTKRDLTQISLRKKKDIGKKKHKFRIGNPRNISRNAF